jgi:hypothetical protein
MAAAIINVRLKIMNLVDKGRNAFWNLNLFQSVPPTQDPLKLRKQHFSTRLFLFLFIFSLIIFTIYTSQVAVDQPRTVENPSYSLYTQLFAEYPKTLTCPCTTIAIPNKDFLELNASYHEVCSSIFVQDQWIDFLIRSQIRPFASIEFRYTGIGLFQMLTSLCEQAKQMIDDELLTFADTPFITANVVSSDLFSEQTIASVDLLISSLQNNFMNLLSLINFTTTADVLVSGFLTNVDYRIGPHDQYWFKLHPVPHIFQDSNCTCLETPSCISRAFITSDG